MEDKKFELINRKSKLPYLITNFNDFFIASNLLTKPNFVTISYNKKSYRNKK